MASHCLQLSNPYFFQFLKNFLIENFKPMQKSNVIINPYILILQPHDLISISRLLYLSPNHSFLSLPTTSRPPNHSETNPIHAKLLKVLFL